MSASTRSAVPGDGEPPLVRAKRLGAPNAFIPNAVGLTPVPPRTAAAPRVEPVFQPPLYTLI